MRFNLLTPASANSKLQKNDTDKYLGAILHLAPSMLSGHNVCPKASIGCASACLNTAGRGAFSNVQAARIRKTKLYFENRILFLQWLKDDLEKLQRAAERQGKKPYARLNGTSDLPWFNVIKCFPGIQFYDYTKRRKLLDRLRAENKRGALLNYSLTFSASEDNHADVAFALASMVNVAMVFDVVPQSYHGTPVINGDESDLRFLDPVGVTGLIVGLKAKGKAKQDASGFVRRPADEYSESIVV